jgi:hypothetical protein
MLKVPNFPSLVCCHFATSYQNPALLQKKKYCHLHRLDNQVPVDPVLPLDPKMPIRHVQEIPVATHNPKQEVNQVVFFMQDHLKLCFLPIKPKTFTIDTV